jgi:Domain of unknown function (DUF5916)
MPTYVTTRLPRTSFFVVILCFSMLQHILHAQVQPASPTRESKTYTIKKASGKIILDGKMDELDWGKAETGGNFIAAIPVEGEPTAHPTEFKLTFDDQYIYVYGKCFQKRGTLVVQSLRRDFGPGSTDLFGINFDPFRDRQNAFHFSVSAVGVQREGLVFNGGDLAVDWDNRWFSKVVQYDDYRIVEMAIPFKSLRYKQQEGQNEWNLNLLRFDQSAAQPERSSWSPIPRQFSGNNINFPGKLIWETPPPKQTFGGTVIPYVLGQTAKNYLDKTPLSKSGNLGLDAKIPVTSSLNLDVTVNPDFAQVEVDRQVTNLSRFELFFPERRQFFLENADLFSSFGFENINPFFSRRIGLAKDQNDNLTNVPIWAGARLSGRLDKNWRVGALTMQTGAKSDLKIAPTNFSALAIQRRVLTRSNVGFLMVNKQNYKFDLEKDRWVSNPSSYNRVGTLNFNYFSPDGKLFVRSFGQHSFSPTPSVSTPFSAGTYASYRSTNWIIEAGTEIVDKSFNAEVGYVPRNNYYRFEPSAIYIFWTKNNKKLLSWSIGVDGDMVWRKTDNRLTDWDLSPLMFDFRFQNSAQIRVNPLRVDYTYLFDAFDPTNTGGKKLEAGTSYTYPSVRLNYHNDLRKKFNFTTQVRTGRYFNGTIFSAQNQIGYRVQPYGIVSLDVTYNRINLPEGYNDRSLWLVGPRVDLTLTPTLYLTTFVQYNNQVNNVNLNTRFQWRFAPVSDLFLVYTDNYFAYDDNILNYRAFESKNRALVLKCTYWLNL